MTSITHRYNLWKTYRHDKHLNRLNFHLSFCPVDGISHQLLLVKYITYRNVVVPLLYFFFVHFVCGCSDETKKNNIAFSVSPHIMVASVFAERHLPPSQHRKRFITLAFAVFKRRALPVVALWWEKPKTSVRLCAFGYNIARRLRLTALTQITTSATLSLAYSFLALCMSKLLLIS